ncbi:hypothetical protein YC2023_083138 [Brassica napus]
MTVQGLARGPDLKRPIAGRDWAKILWPVYLRVSRDRTAMSIVFFSSTQYSVDDHVQSSIRLWALSGEVLSHDSSPRWFVWYSGVPASQQNLEDTDETCADSRYHFDHGSGSQLNESRFDLCRFLVPRDMTVGHFIHMLSNRLHRTTFRKCGSLDM